MTQREYEYFMLMKRKDVDSQSPNIQKEGLITGVVTYLFNHNYGDKPDVGTEVFILPQKYQHSWSDVLRFETEVLSRANTRLSNMTGVESREQAMPESDFHNLEGRVDSFVDSLRYGHTPDIIKAIADGGGSFSAKLPPGTYFLIARSAHRFSTSNKVEMLAQIEAKIGEVNSNQTSSVQFRFLPR